MHIYFNWTSLRCNKKKFDLARETGEEEKKLQKKNGWPIWMKKFKINWKKKDATVKFIKKKNFNELPLDFFFN